MENSAPPPDEIERRAEELAAKAAGRKFRYMTAAEEEAAFFERERDAIHRDWVEAEKVVEAVRRYLSPGSLVSAAVPQMALAAYDAYLAADPKGRTWKAKADEPSGLPERGPVSTGASVKGSGFTQGVKG